MEPRRAVSYDWFEISIKQKKTQKKNRQRNEDKDETLGKEWK